MVSRNDRNRIMKYGKSIASAIHWASVLGKIPTDVAERIQGSLAHFKEDTALFDSPGLRGPPKRAELVIKLGYWLAVGQLSEKEFRCWVDCIPDESNVDWDVDLLPAAAGVPFPYTLKMGPLAANPESCLVQAHPLVPNFDLLSSEGI